MNLDLFDAEPRDAVLADGAHLLGGFALPVAGALLEEIARIEAAAPFRHLVTPGGHRMSVAMTNCGALGWISEPTGYRYGPIDPLTGQPWPALPAAFLGLAATASRAAGYEGFAPDACLINRYEPGARLTLHQDRDERNLAAPIVSVSLGLPATFQFGGLQRTDRPARVRLIHGDVVVWGGPSRLAFHGVLPLADGDHPLTGRQRLNITFRQTR